MMRLTFKMRSYARADKPRRVIARSSICSSSKSVRHRLEAYDIKGLFSHLLLSEARTVKRFLALFLL